jgi:hypothetical protein
MMWVLLTVVTVLLSAMSTRFLLAAIIEGPIYVGQPDYKVLALRVGRAYRIFSWSVITLVLIATLIQLFWQSAENFLF